MAGKRKRYSADFKTKVALEALKGELTLSQLVTKHGVHQTMIAGWRRQAVKGLSAVFSGQTDAVHAARQHALDNAFCINPERFVNKQPVPPAKPAAA
ncbi:MAG TPA: transposase, partial [Pseudolabrys sp.]